MASREEGLASFDAARGMFVDAYAGVPDDALAFLVPGEDYALGGLVVHANTVLDHYQFVFEGLVGGGFETFRAADPPGFWEQAGEAAKAGLTPADRVGAFAGLEARHARFVYAARALPEQDWVRKAEVFYGDAQEPYPTSPEDILGWLIAHYLEHVPQVAELHQAWQGGS
ncbi:MAG: hypothetical protein ACRDJO_13070 [Actinomycetota bacterium]